LGSLPAAGAAFFVYYAGWGDLLACRLNSPDITICGDLLKTYIVVSSSSYMGNETISGTIFRNVMAQQCLTCGGFKTRGLPIKDNEGFLMPCMCGDE